MHVHASMFHSVKRELMLVCYNNSDLGHDTNIVPLERRQWKMSRHAKGYPSTINRQMNHKKLNFTTCAWSTRVFLDRYL